MKPLRPEELAAILAPVLSAFDAGQSASSLSRQHGIHRHSIAALLRLAGRTPRRGQPQVTTWCPPDQVMVYQKLRRYLGAQAARAEIERVRA